MPNDPEFNRYYIKWQAADWLKGAIVTAAGWGIEALRLHLDIHNPTVSAFIASGATILLVLIAVLVFAIRRRPAAIPVESPLEIYKGELRWREGRMKQVGSKEFKNQEVPLDGIEYIDCTFDGVTFVYNGTGKTAISGHSIVKLDSRGKPNISFRFGNPLVGSIVLVFQALGFLREDVQRRIESAPLERQ